MFHSHKWKVVSTDYTEPYNLTGPFVSTQQTINSKMGTTHIYSKCEVCGDIKQRDVTGKYTE